MKVTGRGRLPERVRLDAVPLLACGRYEGCQRRVARAAPDGHHARHPQIYQVVVDDGSARGGRVDPDVALGPRAIDAVIDTDVVGRQCAARAALEVDPGGYVVVGGVREDALAGRAVVVDAVVAIGVRDVVKDQVVV